MRTTNYYRPARPRFDVQMTPMIDVVFQLLIFFVCTVNFRQLEQALPLTPAAAAQSAGIGDAVEPLAPELEDLRQVEIVVARPDDRTTWTVNGDVCASLDDVGRRLTALARLGRLKALVPVVLDVADEVPLGDAVDVYDIALRLGFEKVQFVAKDEE